MPTARTNKATSSRDDSSKEKIFAHEEVKQIESLQLIFEEIKSELSKVIVGQDDAIEKLFLCLLSKGHGLLMGVPGLAKTLLVNSLAQTSSLSFGRIQFTPDLMPSDVTAQVAKPRDLEKTK